MVSMKGKIFQSRMYMYYTICPWLCMELIPNRVAIVATGTYTTNCESKICARASAITCMYEHIHNTHALTYSLRQKMGALTKNNSYKFDENWGQSSLSIKSKVLLQHTAPSESCDTNSTLDAYRRQTVHFKDTSMCERVVAARVPSSFP